MQDVYDPISGELLVKSGQLIDDLIADKIENSSVETVEVRSALTCESKRGFVLNVMEEILQQEKMFKWVKQLV